MIRLQSSSVAATAVRTLTLAGLALLASCDSYFGSRPIGGGDWEGTQATVHAPASETWEVVEATLEELGAGKMIAHPEGAETAVRVTWSREGENGRWLKVAVDSARAYNSVVSAYAMNDLELGQQMVRELVDALRASGIDVEEPHYRSADELGEQRLAGGRMYKDGYWTTWEGEKFGHHDDGHGHDDHGDGHGEGHDDDHGGDHGDDHSDGH
ncbi:MAG: hypothetical protein AAFZ65_13190 [Planctomycetota bacterium]